MDLRGNFTPTDPAINKQLRSKNGGADTTIVSSSFPAEVLVEVLGGSGDDTISAYDANNKSFFVGKVQFYGGGGGDTLIGSAGQSDLFGEDGDDTIYAGRGVATIDGGLGNDRLGGLQADGAASPTTNGGVMVGGLGQDIIDVGDLSRGKWTLIGGELLLTAALGGSDAGNSIYGGSNADTIIGGHARFNGSANAYEPVFWTGTSSTLAGGGGDDVIYGTLGDDLLAGGAFNGSMNSGADTLFGGPGSDVLIASNFRIGTVDGVWAPYESNPAGNKLMLDTLDGGDASDLFLLGIGTSDIKALGGNGDDVFLVANDYFSDAASLNSVTGTIEVDAGAGAMNRLAFNDIAGTGKTATITNSKITGLTAGEVRYGGGAFAAGNTHAGIFVHASNNKDSITVTSTDGDDTLRIHGNNGDDTFTVGVGDIDTIAGAVELHGDGSADKIFVNDSGHTRLVDYELGDGRLTSSKTDGTARTFAGLFFGDSNEDLRLDGADESNIFDVTPSLFTQFIVDGNLPAPLADCAAKGDYLRLNTRGTNGRNLVITQPGAGFWTFASAHKNVRFESIERFNHVDIVAIPEPAGKGNKPRVRVFDAETMEFKFEFLAYEAAYEGGVSVAVGDVNEDGLPDVVTAPGRLRAPEVRVFNGSPQSGVTGGLIAGLTIPAAQTYGTTYSWGVNVAVGDVNGDGCNDIVTAPRRYTDNIKVFQNDVPKSGLTPFKVVREFDAFAELPNFIGGANVAVADLDGETDGNRRGDIIVGNGSGIAGQVRVFDVTTSAPSYNAVRIIKDTDLQSLNGIFVAAGDVDGNGTREILTSGLSRGSSLVKLYNGATGALIRTFQVFTDKSLTAPALISVSDFDYDGNDEFYVHQMEDGRNASEMRIFETDSSLRIATLATLTTAVPSMALQLDRDLGLTFTGNYSLNWGGLNEKWMRSTDATWYFITPDGVFHQLLGGKASNNLVIAELPDYFYSVPELLHQAVDTYASANADFQAQLQHSSAAALDAQFNLTVTGKDWFNWSRQNERWLYGNNGWYYITPQGDLYKSNSNASNKTWLGRIDSRFNKQIAALAAAKETNELDKSLGLFRGASLSENWGGLSEWWLRGANNSWYFITKDGKFFRWNGSRDLSSSTYLKHLDAVFYNSIDLLAEASML